LVKIDEIQCLPVQLFVVFEDTGCTCKYIFFNECFPIIVKFTKKK
jgi:hypothetical protein